MDQGGDHSKKVIIGVSLEYLGGSGPPVVAVETSIPIHFSVDNKLHQSESIQLPFTKVYPLATVEHESHLIWWLP